MKQKPGINQISRSLLSLPAIILCTVTACTVESEDVESDLFIRNNTSYSVNIRTFNYGSEKPVYDIYLESGERWYKEINGGPGGGAAVKLGSDSALFTFDDTLQVSFSIVDCPEDSIAANILCSSSWTSVDPKEGHEHAHEYIVTEEVYELAE